LTLWYAAAAFLLIALTTSFLYWGLVRNVDREDDQFLVDTIQILRALMRERPADVAALQQEVEWEGAARRYAKVYMRILDDAHRVVVETQGASAILDGHPIEPAPPDAEPGPGFEVTSPAGASYRVLAAVAPVGTDGRAQRVIEAALDRTSEQQLLRTYRARMWGVLALALLASGMIGHAIAQRGMRPIDAIAATARGIGSSTLADRIPTTRLPAELASLAETFNQMLMRLDDAFARLSSLSADLAHELRTPVNNLRGEVEVALGKTRSAAEYRDTLGSVLEDAVRLSNMVDSLLFLARAEHPGEQIRRAPLDVRKELSLVREFYEPAAAEAGVEFELDADGDGLVAALDRTLFQRAVSNLITNALTHTPSGGRVRLAASASGHTLQIGVADSGTGIPPEHLARVSDRFYRVARSEKSPSEGLGLGLAIVASIMRFHQGSLQVASDPGRGTTVTLTFPDAVLEGHRIPVAERDRVDEIQITAV
jgi:two-component system heavy metal sensor histidine kinase CusS